MCQRRRQSELAPVVSKEPPTIDINAIDNREGLQESPDIAVDSGAGASVARKDHFPACEIKPSPGSIAGQEFVGATGHSMRNNGQMEPKLLLEPGFVGNFKFQETETRKPLLAVCDVNAKGNPVVFDGKGRSYVIAGSDPLVEELRALIQKIQAKIPLHLSNGVFTMKSWDLSGFPRQP